MTLSFVVSLFVSIISTIQVEIFALIAKVIGMMDNVNQIHSF
jgi:hypothetical protein